MAVTRVTAERESVVVLHARVVSGTGGGPDKTILNSPRFLAETRYKTLCAYMHTPGSNGFEELRQRAFAQNAPLLPVSDRGAGDWRVFTQLLSICWRERVAIWHGHDYKSDLLGLLLRPFWPMRLVTTVHGWGVANTRPLYNWIDRVCLPYYERVVCVSEDLRQRSLECGVRPDRCLVIENGIDTEQHRRRFDLASAKRRLGLSPGRAVVGAVGRLSAEKGFDLLIRAFADLVRSKDDVQLLLVGDGSERPRLEALITELGLGDRVRLLGFRADTLDVFESMDVYALSSRSEGLPNVLLEAMAVGVPVVATRVGGVPRLVKDEVNGLLIEPGSVGGLASALARVLTDTELRGRLGRAGREVVESDYDFKHRIQKFRELYDDLLGRRSRPC